MRIYSSNEIHWSRKHDHHSKSLTFCIVLSAALPQKERAKQLAVLRHLAWETRRLRIMLKRGKQLYNHCTPKIKCQLISHFKQTRRKDRLEKHLQNQFRKRPKTAKIVRQRQKQVPRPARQSLGIVSATPKKTGGLPRFTT